MLRTLSVSISAVVGLTAASAFATNYDVYIAAGQSNMDGRGLASDLTGSLAPYAAVDSNVKIYYANPVSSPTTTGWVNLQPGYSYPPDKKTPLPADTFGPEIGFGHAMEATEAPGHQVAIVKVSEGNTSLSSDWNPNATSGKQLFSLMISTTKTAMAALATPGNTVTLCGMIWHQGEADATTATGGQTVEQTYQSELTAFINDVRTELKTPNLPFVVGEITVGKYGTDVPAAQTAVGTMPGFNTGFASSVGLTTYNSNQAGGRFGNGVHFIASSQIELGQRFAAAMQPLVPEPTSLGLAGGGVMLLGRRRRYKSLD